MSQAWGELEAAFAAAVVDPDRPVPAGVAERGGASERSRFAIHRNNVMVGLVDALEARFPVTARLVGDVFFQAMARAYVPDHLPRSPVLLEYGDDFADFIGQFPLAESVPYLADVARLEAAWSEAYHAADASPLDLDALRRTRPAELVDACPALHPTLRLVRSEYPVAAIWSAHQRDEEVGASSVWQAEDVLAVRPHEEVLLHALDAGGHEFLAALQTGASLGQAGEAALKVAPEFDLGRHLVELVRIGAIVALGRDLPALPCYRKPGSTRTAA